MSRKIFIDVFFDQFISFINELKQMYPEDTDFNTFLTTLNLLKNTNPMLVVNYIKSEVIDIYEDKITTRDETFFLEQSYSQKNADMNIIFKLKEYVKGMSPASKEVVWQYIDLLMKLCIKIIES
jgi:hypothetical protein